MPMAMDVHLKFGVNKVTTYKPKLVNSLEFEWNYFLSIKADNCPFQNQSSALQLSVDSVECRYL